MVDTKKRLLSLLKKIRKNDRTIGKLKKGKLELDYKDTWFFKVVNKYLEEHRLDSRYLQDLLDTKDRNITNLEYKEWYKAYLMRNIYDGFEIIIKKEYLLFDIVIYTEYDLGGDWSWEYTDVPHLSKIRDHKTDSFDFVYLNIVRAMRDVKVEERMNNIIDKMEEISDSRIEKIIKLIEENDELRKEIREIELSENITLGV